MRTKQTSRILAGLFAAVLLGLLPAGTRILPDWAIFGSALAQQSFPAIAVPPGFRIEKVVDGLTYPTAVAWDDQDRLYIAEAGGQFLEEPAPPRILLIENGRTRVVVNLVNKSVGASLVGMTWHDGAFFITHRHPLDRTGAVSRVTLDGAVTTLFRGIIDSQAEHQVNDIRVGPDGRMYLASGPAGNAAVVGIDIAPFVDRSPGLRATPCQEIVLTGRNFETPDFRTKDPSDTTRTGAFVPFGMETTAGQRIPGNNKCGGAILAFDPNNAEATLKPFAHGLRNVIGIAFNARGEMYAAVNGYDVRGSRPFNDRFDPTYIIRPGAWYGWPDFSATFEPITSEKFALPPAIAGAIRVVNGQPVGKEFGFVIDHRASGLQVPDQSVILGLHPINSSPSKLDIAPASFGAFGGHVFVAEWGDLTPPTNPLGGPAGYRVSRIDPATRKVEPFAANVKPGPASKQGPIGQGLERPFDVRFGPDGAMYIVDYGVANINPARAAQGQVPYEFPPRTGVVWRVTRQ